MIRVLTSRCQYLPLGLLRPDRSTFPPQRVTMLYVCGSGRGVGGPAGERTSTVTAVFIGTQVSSGALGSLDNALSPHSPL